MFALTLSLQYFSIVEIAPSSNSSSRIPGAVLCTIKIEFHITLRRWSSFSTHWELLQKILDIVTPNSTMYRSGCFTRYHIFRVVLQGTTQIKHYKRQL